MVLCRVLLLDGSDYEIQIDQKTAKGQEVFDKVCEHISLLEKDYFGCTFRDKESRCWLRLDKKISKQIPGTGSWTLTFAVKFYPPNPAVLREELTRYLLFLQLRTDMIAGRLPCSFLTQALLGSYAVQSQIGDHDDDEHKGCEHLKDIQFGPSQTEELLEKIVELHRTHRSDSPAVAEMAYLDNAKNIAMYGVHLYPVKVEGELANVSVGVCCIGLLIYKDRLRTNRFSWAKIIKISYKRDKFFIKLRADENEKKGEKLAYKLPDVPRAAALWRIAMEHHTFFRMKEAENPSRHAFSRAGGYVFAGRTYYQAQLAADQIQRTGQDFNRMASARYISSKSLNALMTGGFSTEREEKHIAEQPHAAATLNLKKGFGSQSSIHFGDYDHDDDLAMGRGYDLVASRLVDQYGRPLDQDPNAHLYGMDAGYEDPRQMNIAAGYAVNGFGSHGYNYNTGGSRATSQSSRAVSPNLTGNAPVQPMRDRYGNVVLVKNYSKQVNGSVISSEDDRLMEHGGYRVGRREDGEWNQPGVHGSEKTTTRTYTMPDGTVVTEYRTERDGVIETKVEKRTRKTTEYEEEIDYDAALARAIRAVTDMNPDLAVEKIEIHTKSEETMA